MNSLTIQNQLVDFLRTVTGNASLDATSDLADVGATDSLTMMDMLVFIETEFQVRLAFTDLTPEVFSTVRSVSELIARRLAPAQRSEAA